MRLMIPALLLLAACVSGAQRFQVLPNQTILLKGDSIAQGYGFGNYTDPSPLRTIPGIGAILLKANAARGPGFQHVPNVWKGLNPDGSAKTVDTLAAELNASIKDGRIATGDWLIYEDAGQIDGGIHPAPWPWKKDLYLQYRRSLGDMVRSIQDVVDRSHIVFMTMFDYDPVCATCKWDAKLDMVGRTGNDAIRDEAAELGIRVIDMNRIMDAAHDYLQGKGWGRPVGPDGIHPNVYGNYVMTLAILGELGAEIANWKLDALYQRFSHPVAGGDVSTIWGFLKDPSDQERRQILDDLRAIVVRELDTTKSEVEPGITGYSPVRVIRHGKVLGRMANPPKEALRPAVYEVGHIYQLDRERCFMVASIREEGGHDFEIGNDAFVFSRLEDIDEQNAIPINRYDVNYKLKSNGKPAVQGRFPTLGGFVPIGAKLPDGKPHPAAGTGFLFSGTLTFLPDRSNGHPEAGRNDRDIEFIQIKADGRSIKVSKRELIFQLAGVSVGRVGLSNCAPQDAGFLCPFAADDGTYVVVIRLDYDGKEWKASKAGKPFLNAKAPEVWKQNRVYRWLETEASIQNTGSGFLVYTRGYDVKGRVYSSKDGLNFTFVFDHYNYNSPQTLNQGLDGSLYQISNPGPGLLRNPLYAYPLRGKHFMEPWVVHDERRVRSYPNEPDSPFCDHAVGQNVFLEGRWRHFVCYRVIGLHETDGKGAPAGPRSGVYVIEPEYDRVVRTPFRF